MHSDTDIVVGITLCNTALEFLIFLSIAYKLWPSKQNVLVAQGRVTQVPAVVFWCLTRAEYGFREIA